jgi:hypothetical protein
LFVALIVINLIFSDDDSDSTVSTMSLSVNTVAITDLSEAYEGNEIAADAAYKNRTLVVTGVIDLIDVSIFDEAFINLESCDGYARYYLRCFFKDRNDLIALSEGQVVEIQGRCTGKSDWFYYVIFENCELITAYN